MRTRPSTPAVAAALALAALVACQGGGKQAAPAARSSDATPAPPPGGDGDAAAPALTAVDRSAEARAVFATWNAADAVTRLHAEAHPRFRQSVKLDELEIFHGDFTALLGRFVEVTTTTNLRRQAPDGTIEDMVFGEARFERGPAAYELVLVEDGGALRLHNFKLDVPRASRPPVDRAAGRAVARAAADAVLAADYPALDALSLPRIRAGRTPDDTAVLTQRLAELGGRARLELVADKECGELQHCMDYRAVGGKGGAALTIWVSAPLGRWRVNHWSFTPDEDRRTP